MQTKFKANPPIFHQYFYMHPYRKGTPKKVKDYLGHSGFLNTPLQVGREISDDFGVYSLEQEFFPFSQIVHETKPTILLIGSFS